MNNINNETNNDDASNEDELLRELFILNLSITMLYVFILAVFLNLHFVYWEKYKLLDIINNTDFSKDLPDYSEAPKIAARLYLLATSVFLGININELNNQLSIEESNRSELGIKGAEKRVMASFLAFIASGLNNNNLNL